MDYQNPFEQSYSEYHKKKSPLPVIIAVIAVILLAAGGITAYLLLSGDKDDDDKGSRHSSSTVSEDEGGDDEGENKADDDGDHTSRTRPAKTTKAARTTTTTAATTTTTTGYDTNVKVNKTSVTIAVGETDYALPIEYPYGSDETNEQWHSNNPDIATVDNFGYITGVKPGSCVVWLTFDNNPEAEVGIKVEVVSDEPLFEPAVEVGEGDAYLQIVNGDWWIQYTGQTTDYLAYDAGVVHINGNGNYTVSVTADTAGFRYAATGDADSDVKPSGLSFAAVVVRGGASLYPNMSIEITGIKVDGKKVPLTAKNFTCADDSYVDDSLEDMRANIYNQWVSDLPEDAHDSTGNVKGVDGYSATIIDTNAFEKEWTTVEVEFKVSGI